MVDWVPVKQRILRRAVGHASASFPTSFRSDHRVLLCSLVECTMIRVRFKLSDESWMTFALFDCIWYLSSSMKMRDYLFWSFIGNEPVFRSVAVLYLACVKNGGHSSGFSCGVLIVTFSLAKVRGSLAAEPRTLSTLLSGTTYCWRLLPARNERFSVFAVTTEYYRLLLLIGQPMWRDNACDYGLWTDVRGFFKIRHAYFSFKNISMPQHSGSRERERGGEGSC